MNEQMQPVVSWPPPRPGQLWHLNDTHHGNVLAVCEGERAVDEWVLTAFEHHPVHGWMKGRRDVLASRADFASGRMRCLGTLPVFRCLHDSHNAELSGTGRRR